LRADCARKAVAQKKVPNEVWKGVEKAIEIDNTLREMADAGMEAVYHACDVSDRAAMAGLLDEIRRTDGPIEGIVHGAGVERASRFTKKDPQMVSSTIAAKVDGAAVLLDLTRRDPLRFFVGFGSVAGRWGSIGQTDYALASDMLCKLVDWYRVQHPECRATCFHWQPWAEIGMAAREETKGSNMLWRTQLLPAAEGVQHFLDELLAGAPEPEVLITDWQYYKLFCPDLSDKEVAEIFSPTPAASQVQARIGASPVPTAAPTEAAEPASAAPGGSHVAEELRAGALIDRVVAFEPGRRAVAEIRLDPVADPFLREHRLRDRPTLPVVVALEAFAEAALALDGGARSVAGLREVRIPDALRFFSEEPRVVRIHAETTGQGAACRLTSDFRNRRGQLVEKDRLHFSAVVELAAQPAGIEAAPPPAHGEWFDVTYPPREALLYHGPPLRLLKRIAVDESGAWGEIHLPAGSELAGSRDAGAWLTPSAAIDACFYACGIYTWVFAEQGVTVPESLAELRFGRPARPSEQGLAHVACRNMEPNRGLFDFALFGDDGTVIFQAKGYRCYVLRGGGL
jgi:NAD(P)-dependent dehydrogenase (short-subunit alcohol dehydrogenase family)